MVVTFSLEVVLNTKVLLRTLTKICNGGKENEKHGHGIIEAFLRNSYNPSDYGLTWNGLFSSWKCDCPVESSPPLSFKGLIE